ncbi:MAG: hypothetical protein JNK67_24985 [Alphaproteobacteria bacterium]|nr:hypothetical protein [Alphaproteobacteria bacterium]
MQVLEVIVQVVLFDLVSPITFVPAIAVGWFAGSRGQRIGGIVLLVAVKIGLSFLEPLPEDAMRAWEALPLLAVAPAAWAFATAALRDWLRNERASDPASPRLRRARAAVGAVIGAPLGAILGGVLGMIAVDVFRISSFEGGAGYFVAFLFFLPGLAIGGILGAVLAARRGVPRA